MKINEVIAENAFDTLKKAYAGGRALAKGRGLSGAQAAVQGVAGDAEAKRYANSFIQSWNRITSGGNSDMATSANLKSFVQRLFPTAVKINPAIFDNVPADPLQPSQVSQYILNSTKVELAARVGALAPAATSQTSPQTEPEQTPPADDTAAAPAPAAPSASAAPDITQGLPPIQVRVPGHGIITKGPQDDKWRDEQGDLISNPTDIAHLERMSTSQRQNRQMQPGRAPDAVIPSVIKQQRQSSSKRGRRRAR